MWTYTLLCRILDMSLTASIVIVAVLFARLLLKRAPKIFSYALWGVVLFRLVCPISFSSEFALLGNINTISLTNGAASYVQSNNHSEYLIDAPYVQVIGEPIKNNLSQIGMIQTDAGLPEFTMSAATTLWIFGMAIMIIYCAVSLIGLHRKLVGAVRLRDNIYIADHIGMPFVIGIINPRIYLPSTLSAQEQTYIILHEQVHIKRFDHIVKMIAFLALCVHWFNPLVWVAFICAVRDMEMSCDEHVLKQLGGGIKEAYSTSLLFLAAGRYTVIGNPLAFGKGNIKGRIKNMMNFEKPKAWVLVVSTLLVAMLSIGFATNRLTEKMLTAQTALDAFSVENRDGRIIFVIPENYEGLQNWDITVAGRAEYEDGFSRSLHFFENENEAKIWKAGKEYIIEIEDAYTELHITASLPDENGKILLRNFDFDFTQGNFFDAAWVLIAEADLSGNGIKEYIYLDKSQINSTFDVTLRVLDSTGNEIWKESGNKAHAGWKSLFLCRIDEKEYLLRYTPYMGQGYGTYKYSLFTLEGGVEKVYETNTLEFDLNGAEELNVRQMIAFADEVNSLLGKSTMLMSTDGGTYSFGPASAAPFYEKYSWLGEFSELFSKGDDLSKRLQKFSKHAVSTRVLSDVTYAYKNAREAYGWFAVSTMPTVNPTPGNVLEYNGRQYVKVSHDTIKNMAALEGYLRTLFSDGIVKNLLHMADEIEQYKDFDGSLYATFIGRGSDINKGGETYSIVQIYNDKIIFRVTVELLGDWDGSQSPVIGGEDHDLTYEKIGGKWVFSSFELVR